MPHLSKGDAHVCPFCQYSSSIRKDMKLHLTTSGRKGIRCSGLKKILPISTWTKKVVPYFKDDVELPDLSSYRFKSPIGRRKRKSVDALVRKTGSVGAVRRGDVKRRILRDNLIGDNDKCIYSKADLLAMLHTQCDNDERWVLRKMETDGAANIRRQLSTPTQDVHARLSPREALELKLFTGLSIRAVSYGAINCLMLSRPATFWMCWPTPLFLDVCLQIQRVRTWY